MKERIKSADYWSDEAKFERWLLEKKDMTIEELKKLLPGKQNQLKSEWSQTRKDLYTGSLDGM